VIQPRNPDVLRALARQAEAEGRTGDAIGLLNRAVEAAPGFALAVAEWAQLLQREGRSETALQLLDSRALEFPEAAWPLSIKAALLDADHRTEDSLAVHDKLVALIPHIAIAWLNYGHALRTVGRTGEAVSAYRKAIELEPANGAAWWALASIRVEPSDVEALEQALRGAEDIQRIPLHFALGRALESAGDFERSFGHYEAGNELRARLIPSASAGVEELVSRSQALFTRQFFNARAGWGCPAEGPIFIVGMPRAGSTLVEHMLAAHPQVEALGELPHLRDIAQQVGGAERVGDLRSSELANLGERYLASTMRYRRTAKPYFTDKLPANWQSIGLIRLMLPNARIIDVRREPMPCCFANFAFYFNRQTNLATGLGDLGRYYLSYTRLIAHYSAILPDRLRTISYERLVENPEKAVRAMLAFLGLPFQPDCARPPANDRSIHTPSAEQVRQPVHGAANLRWHFYEPWLAPLSKALKQ
jgi:tetratricopeptide (TPR) repeat protein